MKKWLAYSRPVVIVGSHLFIVIGIGAEMGAPLWTNHTVPTPSYTEVRKMGKKKKL